MVASSILSCDLFKVQLCSSIRGWAILSGYITGADGYVVLEPSNCGIDFVVALKGHSQGHLFIGES